MANRELIDSRFRKVLDDRWPSLCTIQTIVYGTNASNQRLAATYDPIDSMRGLACRLGPISASSAQYDEKRTDRTTTSYNQRVLIINAYLPALELAANAVEVDGVQYLIRGIDTDSQKFMTRLRVEIVT